MPKTDISSSILQAQRDLMFTAANVGHRIPPGHIANTEAVLLGVVPEHPEHARRRLQILARLTADLTRAMASRDRGGSNA
jgi:hypothetical protein